MTVHTGASTGDLAVLITELQSAGLRVEAGDVGLEGRRGGAGPSDSGMLWIEGVAVTVPTDTDFARTSPYVLRPEDEGFGIWRDGVRLAAATGAARPRYYDLSTADGIPYWKIALLHLDSLASTVNQTCAYWGNDDQCAFCGIGLSLTGGRTTAKKRPEQLAEVAVAAKELDGAVDATLTTGSTAGADKGALYVGRCGQAVKEAAGLPVEVQFEPPDPGHLDVIDRVHDMGVDSVGIHVESFDPVVLARIAPAKARTGIEGYFAAWERAVALFGEGQVSTYVILGMGEDPELTVAGCRRAIDMGVYPFVVPLRPIAGSLLEDCRPPSAEYTESIYRQVVPYLTARGLGAAGRGRRLRPVPGVLGHGVDGTGGGGGVLASAASAAVTSPPPGPPMTITPVRRKAFCFPAATRAELETHHRIRHQVFVEEQGLFQGSDVDSHDAAPDTVHALGLCDGVAVGVVRLFPLDPDDDLWQGDRLAVLPGFRLGMGAPLVRFAVTTAAARGGREMVAHIQLPNVAFFEKIGWHTYGEVETYVGVTHQPMAIDLRPFRP